MKTEYEFEKEFEKEFENYEIEIKQYLENENISMLEKEFLGKTIENLFGLIEDFNNKQKLFLEKHKEGFESNLNYQSPGFQMCLKIFAIPDELIKIFLGLMKSITQSNFHKSLTFKN